MMPLKFSATVLVFIKLFHLQINEAINNENNYLRL